MFFFICSVILENIATGKFRFINRLLVELKNDFISNQDLLLQPSAFITFQTFWFPVINLDIFSEREHCNSGWGGGVFTLFDHHYQIQNPKSFRVMTFFIASWGIPPKIINAGASLTHDTLTLCKLCFYHTL